MFHCRFEGSECQVNKTVNNILKEIFLESLVIFLRVGLSNIFIIRKFCNSRRCDGTHIAKKFWLLFYEKFSSTQDVLHVGIHSMAFSSFTESGQYAPKYYSVVFWLILDKNHSVILLTKPLKRGIVCCCFNLNVHYI